MWKRSCKEIRNIVEDRNKLENILVADLPGIDMNKIENQIEVRGIIGTVIHLKPMEENYA